MKRVMLLSLVLLLALSASACKSPSEAIGEAVAEKMLESVEDVDVDIDSGEITLEGKEGGKISIGGTKWPDTDIAKTIPEFKKGTISSVISSDDGFMIAIDEVDKKDFENYLVNIKKDFSEQPIEGRTEEIYTYNALNADKVLLMISYDSEMKVLEISVQKTSE
jgi:hypothetical protein